RYSIFTPLLENQVGKKNYLPALKYLQENYKELHQYLFSEIIEGVISSDFDYHIPLKENPKYLGLIPNPINVKKHKFLPFETHQKIIIFLGINSSNYTQKGIVFFEKALEKIQVKFPDKIEIIKAENLPYQEYIKSYEKAHVLLDQVFSFDQGYNALEAMAQGKVVFTGAEKEFLKHYNVKEDEVCINALPNENYLVEKLSFLIENPEKIKQISLNARRFVEENHDYIKVAKQYLKCWKNEKQNQTNHKNKTSAVWIFYSINSNV